MKKIDITTLAFKNFTRRKARSILTILGVVIGTMAVVIMLSIGEGLSIGMEAQVNSWGSITEIEVHPNYSGDGKPTVMDKAALEKLKAIPNVTDVMGMKRFSVILKKGKMTTYTDIVGVDPKAMESFEIKTSAGKVIDGTKDSEAFMGYMIPFNFTNPKKPEYIPSTDEEGKFLPMPFDPMEEEIELTFDQSITMTGPREPGKKPKMYDISVVGTSVAAYNQDAYNVYMDYDTISKWKKEYDKSISGDNGNNGDNSGGGGVIIGGMGSMGGSMGGGNNEDKNLYDNFKVKINDRNNVKDVLTAITDAGFYGSSNIEYLEQMQKQASLIQLVLGGVGAIAFIVSALGITNTMMMSTYERTREIGIMKVMGCKLGDIRDLFLTEACIIGFLGGVVGILLSEIISAVLNSFSGIAQLLGLGGMGGSEQISISIIPIWLVVVGIVFTTLIGLISGFYPAIRAIKLSALEAIKNE